MSSSNAPARGMSRRRQVLRGAASVLAESVWLAACGLPGLPDQAPPPEAKEVTISYLTDWPTSAPRAAFLNTYVPKFMEEHPRITVQVESTDEVAVSGLANAAAGTLQDVLLGANDLFLQLVKQGGWKDITPVLKRLKVNMDDLVSIPSSIKYQGRQYGLPFQPNIAVMTINKTLFRKANALLPDSKTTYQQLLESLQRVVTLDQGISDPQTDQRAGQQVTRPDQRIYGLQTGFGTAQWAHFVWAWGGDLVSPDHKKTLLDQPAAIAGLQFLFDLLQRYRVGTPLDAKGRLPQGVSRNNGNLAMGYTSSPIHGFGKAQADLFELDFMYHPIGPKGKRFVPQGDQPNLVTGSADAHGVFDQAVQFIAWLATSTTAQGAMAANGPEVPVLKAMLKDPAYLAPPPASMHIVFDEIPALREQVVFRGQQEWTDAVRAALLPAFMGQQSATAVAREATRAGDVVLAKYSA